MEMLNYWFLKRVYIWTIGRLAYWSSADRTYQLFREAVDYDERLNMLKGQLRDHIALNCSPFKKETERMKIMIDFINSYTESIAEHYGLKTFNS